MEMFSTACASATLLRQVLLPTSSGLQGPERMAVKTIVSFLIHLCQPSAWYMTLLLGEIVASHCVGVCSCTYML